MLLSSCVSNGSVSMLFSALSLLVIVKTMRQKNMGVDLQCERLLLIRKFRGAFINGHLCKKCKEVLEKISTLHRDILFYVKISD